jgi:nucleoside-diphosphate-sugar epimerase
MRPADRMLLLADITKIRQVTGWTPRITVEESLRDLVAAYGLLPEPSSAR